MAVRAASGVAARSAPRAAFDLRLVSLGAGVVAAGLFLGQQQQPSTCSAVAATTNDKITALETRLNVLEISVAKATSAAFVFNQTGQYKYQNHAARLPTHFMLFELGNICSWFRIVLK